MTFDILIPTKEMRMKLALNMNFLDIEIKEDDGTRHTIIYFIENEIHVARTALQSTIQDYCV